MKVSLLLVLLTVSQCSSTAVVGQAGQNITLTCKYNIKYYNVLPVCWNRGDIPSRGCDNVLASTDGVRVNEETQASSRYRLLGRLSRGDVSLTILNVTEDDAGRYGCRVEIPGWFNDDKHHYDLSVVPQRTPPPSSSPSSSSSSSSVAAASSSSSSWATVTNETAGHMTATEMTVTSLEEYGGLTVVVVSVLLGLVFLVTTGGLFIIGRRWRRLSKLVKLRDELNTNRKPQPRPVGSVGFSSTSSSLQLHSRSAAVDNIYQIDEGAYDYCP